MTQVVKMKQIKKIMGGADLSGMFEEMMGVKDGDPAIITPKFVKTRNIIRHLCKVLTQFASFAPLRNDFPNLTPALDDIQKFVDTVKEDTYVKTDNEEKEEQYSSFTKEEINNLYRKLKDSNSVRSFIVMCNSLGKHKKSFIDPTQLQEQFVNQEPGLDFIIFEFSRLDLKPLWASDKITSVVKRYILSVFATLYKHSHELYDVITSPNADTEQFIGVLLEGIDKLKKHPELNRCKNAFRRIEESIELLRTKFTEYYRDSLISENPQMMVTNFIVDVSNQSGNNSRLTREFGHLIRFMHKASQKSGRAMDPQVKAIFKMVNRNFELMERKTRMASTSPDTSLKSDAGSVTLDSVDTSLKSGSKSEAASTAADTTEPEIMSPLIDIDTVLSPEEIAEEKKYKRELKLKAKKKKKTKLVKSPVRKTYDEYSLEDVSDDLEDESELSEEESELSEESSAEESSAEDVTLPVDDEIENTPEPEETKPVSPAVPRAVPRMVPRAVPRVVPREEQKDTPTRVVIKSMVPKSTTPLKPRVIPEFARAASREVEELEPEPDIEPVPEPVMATKKVIKKTVIKRPVKITSSADSTEIVTDIPIPVRTVKKTTKTRIDSAGENAVAQALAKLAM
jgi:hypothetical protein